MENCVFVNTLRDRPIVLTKYEINKLSETAGHDVRNWLNELRKEHFDIKTLGGLMHALEERLKASPKQ